MSNNGPRYQARYFGGVVYTAEKKGQFDAAIMDTDRSVQRPVALAVDIKSAIIIARALNRDAMS